jgi:hypothetical protein
LSLPAQISTLSPTLCGSVENVLRSRFTDSGLWHGR